MKNLLGKPPEKVTFSSLVKQALMRNDNRIGEAADDLTEELEYDRELLKEVIYNAVVESQRRYLKRIKKKVDLLTEKKNGRRK